MKQCEQILARMDWELLREQKDYCLNELDNNKEAEEIYNGIIHLIDHMQDAAVIDGIATEEEVFGTSGKE